MVDLYTALQPLLDEAAANRSVQAVDAPAEILKLAIVGVPNAVMPLLSHICVSLKI